MCKVANSRDWNLRQIDFKNAFLNAEMDRELYMELPPGLQAYVMERHKHARARHGMQISTRIVWREAEPSSVEQDARHVPQGTRICALRERFLSIFP